MIGPRSFLGPLLSRWRVLTLARQYLLAGAGVLLAGMLAIGFWVTDQITDGVKQNTATATALYVDGMIAPLLPKIDGSSVLSEGARRALDETLSSGALEDRIETFKLWGRDGLITYSSDPALIGKRFAPTESLRAAWNGRVAAEFDDLNDEEDAAERRADVPLLEIYNPIRAPWSGEIVAVAEFYERAAELKSSLFSAQVRSWVVVALVGAGMMGALFGIVLRGSATISGQRVALEGRVAELQRLLAANEKLSRRVREASSRVSAVNERTLRRLSADLHDGPAQLLALASLRLGSPALAAEAGETRSELQQIRGFLQEAMSEIREICRGLALPNIERLDLAALVGQAVQAHERRTGTTVAASLPATPIPLALAEKLTVYRFVQEGLSNAFRHAGGVGQEVLVRVDGRSLALEVRDGGAGMPAGMAPGLGLSGLRDRVESIGGVFDLASGPAGTRLSMSLSMARGVDA